MESRTPASKLLQLKWHVHVINKLQVFFSNENGLYSALWSIRHNGATTKIWPEIYELCDSTVTSI